MSIQSFIQAAQLLYQNSYFDEGLCLVCSAIDASAAKNYPQLSVGDRYKQFISQHFRTISKFGFPGIEASKIRIKLNCQIESLRPDKDGYVDITQIIYHTIRCGLVHSCAIDNSIIFSDQTIIGNYEPNKFTIPRSLIWGLIAAMNEDFVES